MPKTKRKATAAQLRNLAKGRKKLAAMRRAGAMPRKKRPTRPMRPRRKNPDVSHEAWELILFAQSSGEMQPQRDVIIKNVIRKINRGVYEVSKAPRLWQYWMDDAARRYTKEHDVGGGYGIFNAPIRREAAAYIAPLYYDEIKSGEFSHLLALKKKTATKRNPAFGNFMTARNVLKTGRATNPVRKTSGVYVLMSRSGKSDKYYDGVFWGPKANAAHWTSIPVVKRIAQSVSDATGKSISILDVSKK